MLDIHGARFRMCDGVSRRDFLKAGALGIGGLSLADVLRLQAAKGVARTPKSVIMVYLPGGPSHIDMYDLKPDAPVEVRGEFKPIRTNVPGLDVCELMPLHAKMADKFSVVQGVQTIDTHSAEFLMRGAQGNPRRPVFGAVVSKMRGMGPGGMPSYVALGGENGADSGDPTYLGAAYKPFTPGGAVAKSLKPAEGVTLDMLDDRKKLLKSLDTIRRDIDDAQGTLTGMDAFTSRALDMIASPKVREAFDVAKEPQKLRDKYGPASRLLLALRLVQAGVSVVTVSVAGTVVPGGDWDTHGKNDGRTETNWQNLRRKLPVYDNAVTTLITDLYDRGLDKDVCVVVWGEFGRTPKINKDGGRDHWAPCGSVLFAGGGLKTGQSIGDTGPKAERARGTAYTAANVLSTLYHVLGIDPETTFPDFTGRPMYVLDERRRIEELF